MSKINASHVRKETTMIEKMTSIQRDETTLRSSDGDLMAESCFQNDQPTSARVDNNDSLSHSENTNTKVYPFRFIPLTMAEGGRTHIVSQASKQLLEQEVSLQDLQAMTTLFYENAFQDKILDKFIRSHDDPHASRFAKWIVTKLTGSSDWDDDRQTRSKEPVTLADGIRHIVHDRSSAHAAAWYSPKRPDHEIGRHFALDECRVWMRLHFWALRDTGLMAKSPSFADYYVRFIAHFVRVYESTAPTFARDSLRWSEDPANIEKYIANGRVMEDVIGLTLPEALMQLPPNEAYDKEWPYTKKVAGSE
ncbi:hypothetical protein MPSEU_000112800 [Mayamaea pseudoterrestris]|nr:hypothetical protein MPSEU_000112800 [Mayamaea pseudoterrestris]